MQEVDVRWLQKELSCKNEGNDGGFIIKESDVLNEPFGLDEFSYEFYEDPEKVNREFKENIDEIMNLEPKDVKNVGISRTTLWIEKEKIKRKEYEKISDKIKIKLLSVLNKNTTWKNKIIYQF